ncbi:MAG: hypothetical protein ACJA1P_002875, partial [Maribacter sp.]
MYYLVYISRAKSTLSDNELLDILQQSKRNNRNLGITGMLISLRNQFMQVLEGERDTVHSLYKIIAVDQRHIDVRILIEGEIPQRNFTNWSMTFQRMRPKAFENLTGFRFLSEFSNMTEIKDHHHPAIIFL